MARLTAVKAQKDEQRAAAAAQKNPLLHIQRLFADLPSGAPALGSADLASLLDADVGSGSASGSGSGAAASKQGKAKKTAPAAAGLSGDGAHARVCAVVGSRVPDGVVDVCVLPPR